MNDNTITARIPQAFAPLLTSHKRIKLYYGGRGGGKSYAFADSLLIKGRMQKLLIACLREVQDSIKDSVYRLLCSRIRFYQLKDYQIKETKIINLCTGTEFIFKGLRDSDVQKIKSLEGVDIAWIEEGQSISKKSWDILSPTIRKEGSEIWISMNRENETDALWQILAEHPDDRTLICKVNYYDNPFCPKELKLQALKCQKENPADYAHIWLGQPQDEGSKQLISPLLVRNAFNGENALLPSPLIIGLDIARFGDDKTVFCFRKGRVCTHFQTLSRQDLVSIADYTQTIIQEYHPTRIFLDAGGVGAGVYDILVSRGYKRLLRAINFGSRAIRNDRYANRRAEMWDNMRAWLADDLGAKLPCDDDLLGELCTVRKDYDTKGRLLLESKDLLKKRLGRSPDKADALALTFAEPVFESTAPPQATSSLEDLFVTQNTDDKW